MTNTSKYALAVLAAGAMAFSAQATPVTGNIRMSGDVTLNALTVGGSSTATFSNPAGSVTSGTLSFAGTAGSLVDFKGFTFAATGAQPIVDLWKFTKGGVTYEFDLASITSIQRPDNDDVIIKGDGTIRATGFDNTAGNWSFTITDTGAGNFDFGFAQSDTAVPESGTTVALLGLGLLALVGFNGIRKQVA